MSSSKQSECNWLLVEWKNGGRDVVNSKSVVSPLNKELMPGVVMTVNCRGEQETATLVALARERVVLDKMVKAPVTEMEAGPSMNNEEEAEDFSSSASSWVPSDDGGEQSGDSAEAECKKVKLETSKRQYSKKSTKKIITPSHSATAVLPKTRLQSIIKTMMNRKRAHNDGLDLSRKISNNKSLPDSTRSNNLQNGTGNQYQYVKINVCEFDVVNNGFKLLIETLDDLKRPQAGVLLNKRSKKHVPFALKVENMKNKPKTSQTVRSVNQTVDEDVREEDKENSENEEFNRSNDNVLITNKYNKVAVKTAQNKEKENDEWKPIGSGKTLIHRDQFNRVNFKTYTIATRQLLLAAFPRRILATHSLTGKRSPAFQDKPAKMCLDPKIISDIIAEITKRFKVRENLVRSIITTKCADECKMWKSRVNKNKSQNNNENIPPPRPSTSKNTEEQTVM